MNALPFIHSLYVGQPKAITDAQGTWTSSILRDRVDGPVPVQKGGLAGDRVAQPYHGGPDADLCVHLLDHYRFWNAQYGMAMEPGQVGENLTIENLREDQVCAGDIVRVGTALAQVSGPRVPCANLARRIGRPDWVKLTITENRTGFYMRVLEPGVVQAGDRWDLQERLNPNGSIPALNHCLYLDFDPVYADDATNMPGLGDWWKVQLLERKTQGADHWTASMK